MLKVADLSYRYPNGTLALDQVSFQMRAGEKLAIIGPNGAGKSTLIFLLNGILSGSGKIWIADQLINSKNQDILHQKVGVVFQNPDDQLFCPTLYDDVAFGPLNLGLTRAEIDARVADALTRVGLQGRESDSTLTLSFGERKSASLATILAMRPEILIFDEPSSNLDPYHRRIIIDYINELTRTVLIASHDLDLVLDTCTNVLILNKGRVITMGGLELLGDETLLKQNYLELPGRYTHSGHQPGSGQPEDKL
jgi:cobalt/nickel transport system ATP-binding protein